MTPRSRMSIWAAAATMLGALSLTRVYSNYDWLPDVLLVVTAVAVTSLLAHRVRPLAVAAPLLMLVVFAFVVTALYAHGVAPLGFVPGPAAVRHLRTAISDGFTDTTQMSAPVPVTPGLAVLTTGGVGLVAIVVETLATSLRRPAVAGLALLAIFTVPAAILSSGVGWIPFTLATAGYLALLLAEGHDRIGRWGRPLRVRRSTVVATGVPRMPGRGGATAQLLQAGRRVGLTAICLAVVAPVVVPGLHAGWFGTHHTSGAGGLDVNGGGTKINPIVTLRRDLKEVTPLSEFTYTTNGTAGYFRLLSLDTFDGTNWTASSVASEADTDADQQLPIPAGIDVPPTTTRTNVVVTGLTEPFLPVPALPVTVNAGGDWFYNPISTTIYSPHVTTRKGFRYEVVSNTYTPSTNFLSGVVEAPDVTILRYLQTPANLPSNIKTIADSIVNAAQAQSPYAKALALQNWFLANFTYDLNAKSGSSTSALESFLQDRRGYCEQFAATMALMARLEGIPARVDVGFTPGAQVAGTHSYEVTTADAHAWPELYFPGAGWLRFEPTPRSDGQATQPAYGARNVVPDVPTNATAPANGVPNGVPTRRAGSGAIGAGASNGQQNGGFHVPLPKISLKWLTLVVIMLVLLLVTPIVRWRVRRNRWTAADTEAARAHAAWAELGDDLRDLRLEWAGDYDSPRRASGALLASHRLQYDRPAQEALTRMTRAEEVARYAGPAAEARLAALDLRVDEAAVRRALFGSVPRLRRVRARVVPSSTARAFAAASSHIRETVRKAIDAVVGSLRRSRT